MKLNVLFLVQVLLSLLTSVVNINIIPRDSSYTHNLVIDENNPDKFQVFWKLIDGDQIQFELICKTSGWIAMTISDSPDGLEVTDIVIGWIKEGKGYLKDYYAINRLAPLIDVKQDYDLLYANESNGYTILEFKRKLVTCDKYFDRNIKAGTQHITFAWNDKDPDNESINWIDHPSQRFQKAVLFLNYKSTSLEEQERHLASTITRSYFTNQTKRMTPKEIFHNCIIEFMMKNDSIEQCVQVYEESHSIMLTDCFTFPFENFHKLVYLIKFEILAETKTKTNSYNMLYYLCENKEKLRSPQICQKPDPQDECSQIFAKGIGVQYEYIFPNDAGIRIDVSEKSRYLKIEIHYHNHIDIDDSGIKLYFTEFIRDHEIGMLVLGSSNTPLTLQIPPSLRKFKFESTCNQECTRELLTDAGITIISGLQRTHSTGVSVKTELVRDDVIVNNIFDNPSHDSRYQSFIDIEPVKVQKGDALITTCNYKTINRKNFTFMGFTAENEICLSHIYYYPKISKFSECTSQTSPNEMIDFYNILMSENLTLIPNFTLSKENFNAFKLTVNYDKKDKLSEKFEKFYSSQKKQMLFCGHPYYGNITKDDVEFYIPKENGFKIKSNYCNNKGFRNGMKLSLIFILLAIEF